MQQLSGMDAAFLYFETPQAPNHIGAFSIYDQSTAPGGRVTFKGLLANIEKRLHLARCFRQKLVHAPFDLDHPYWVEDADFDLEFHVRHIALPEPGDWRQLCIQVARIHARPLDLSRPLWEMYVIGGLDNVEGVPPGSFALLTKIHHAAIDGVSGAEITAAIHDLSPGAVPDEPVQPWQPEETPSLGGIALRTVVNNLRRPVGFARVVGRAAPNLARAFLAPRTPKVESTGPVPRTRFNGTISPHRVVEGRLFSLQEIRDIRKRVPGATVNDVVLAVCGGAMRRYLDHHGELPEESLVAMAPISVRREDERRAAGNRISAMSVTLHSDVADPLERLARVHEGTRSAKEMAEAIGAETMTDVTQFVPGSLAALAARLYTRLGLANRISPFLNTVITNVPGPQIPLFFCGARMVSTFGLGPVLDGMGLIHPVFSYAGRISISVTSCREMMPDPGFYADCLEASFADLREAAARV
jgi:WS/DGAT/MGAT family acyltransferase